MPSRPVAVAQVGLLVLTGCAEVPGPVGGEASSDSDVASPVSTTHSRASPATTTEAFDVIEYGSLPNGTRQSVRIAIENGSVTRDSDAFDGPDPRKNQRVRYRGATYALAWDTMHTRTEYGLDDVERVNASTLRSGSTVVNYSNLSATAQRMFDRARNGSRPRAYGPDEFPRAYLENGYVEFRGEIYAVTYWVADIPQWELRVEVVDATPDG